MSAREIVTKRTIAAPVELVFQAWTDPKHLAQWYGPNGFTLTTHRMDFKVGGSWHFTFHGPDGKDWDNVVTYKEITSPSRLVADVGDSQNPRQFQQTVTFEKKGQSTEITMVALFPTAQACDAVKGYAVEGGRQTLERLEKFVLEK